jgi:hypothetical protein
VADAASADATDHPVGARSITWVHWLDGGRTAVVNLVPFGDNHHHVVHQPGWVITFDGGTDLRIFRPDRTDIPR